MLSNIRIDQRDPLGIREPIDLPVVSRPCTPPALMPVSARYDRLVLAVADRTSLSA